MFARFLIPVTPICFFLLETELRTLVQKQSLRLSVAALLVVCAAFRWNPFPPGSESVSGIVDERLEYPPRLVDEAKVEGAKLKNYLGELDVSVAYYGTKAMLVYYGELPYAHEAATGLTDVFTAHKPLAKRGRPGHEKRMPYNYLIERQINFVVGGTFRPTPDPNQPEVISFGGAISHIVIYENEVMEALRKYPEVEFLHFPTFLDNYIAQAGQLEREILERDVAFFRRYYFDHNDDRNRREAIGRLLRM
jgi:hypothetical protein